MDMVEPPPRTALIMASSPELAEELRTVAAHLPGWQLEVAAKPLGSATVEDLQGTCHTLLIFESSTGESAPSALVRALRDRNDLRPIVIVSRNPSPELAVEYGRSGADEYVSWQRQSPEVLARAIDNACHLAELRRERVLLNARYQLSQKMEAIGVLAGGLAHDFNNMLASIMGFAELANMKQKRQQPIQNELDYVVKGCRQMAELVQQLVRFSTRRGPQLTQVRLLEIFDDLGAVLGHSIPKSIRVETQLDDPTLIVPANPAMLQQMLMNLCLNAIDSMPQGGVLTLAGEVREASEAILRSHPNLKPGKYLVLTVSDTGCGIPPQNLSRIFDPFFTTKCLSATKGTGLGLSTVWQNATQHGGIVDVASEVGKGSTFRIYLPVELAPPLSATHSDEEPAGGSEWVLVVDDESMILEMTRATLENLGYRVLIAETGTQALAVYERHRKRLGVVVLDISLPDMDGRQICSRLLEANPELPIVFATGHDTSIIGNELLALGARGFLQKPFDPIRLDRALREAMGRPAPA